VDSGEEDYDDEEDRERGGDDEDEESESQPKADILDSADVVRIRRQVRMIFNNVQLNRTQA